MASLSLHLSSASALLLLLISSIGANEIERSSHHLGEADNSYSIKRVGRSLKFQSSHFMRGKNHIVIDPSRVTQLSWQPRAFLYKGFLTHEECDHIIELAKGNLQRSAVTSNADGKSELSEIRTSSGTFLRKFQDKIVRGIEERIAAWTFLPVENGESMQVLRYQHGQKYDAHFDYFHDKLNIKMGGHRYATVLMYLSDVAKGGETVFPNAADSKPKDDNWSDCAKQGLAVKPVKGDAILFFSLHPDATVDEYSLHSGCPVIEGVKWSATKWIHVAPFERPYIDPNKCTDEDSRCFEWATNGECTRNKPFMIGENGAIGSCRKSCNACSQFASN